MRSCAALTNPILCNRVVQLRLDTHADFIAELSVNATKELAIENNIKVRAELGKWSIFRLFHNIIVPWVV